MTDNINKAAAAAAGGGALCLRLIVRLRRFFRASTVILVPAQEMAVTPTANGLVIDLCGGRYQQPQPSPIIPSFHMLPHVFMHKART